eukprot:366573-Chlamydomonas_euryale.AAC.20
MLSASMGYCSSKALHTVRAWLPSAQLNRLAQCHSAFAPLSLPPARVHHTIAAAVRCGELECCRRRAGPTGAA